MVGRRVVRRRRLRQTSRLRASHPRVLLLKMVRLVLLLVMLLLLLLLLTVVVLGRWVRL